MKSGRSSRTAEYMALFRAIETAQPAARRLFEDRYAACFLPGPLRVVALLARVPLLNRAVVGVLDTGWPRTRSSGIVRTRFIDDAVCQALHEGARQLVLLGAGFDSRPYRLAETAGVAVFEVDHPATQAAKRARLASANGAVRTDVHFVAVDFERTDLAAALSDAGFRNDLTSVVVWEGVLSYLSAAAVDQTVATIRRLTAAGSELIFTYVDQRALDGSLVFAEAGRWLQEVRRSGEPFTFGFDPAQLADYLAAHDFTLCSDVSTAEIAARYRATSGRNELGSGLYRVAIAERRGTPRDAEGQ
jgi:methyltransferase (TIGR00027 family)